MLAFSAGGYTRKAWRLDEIALRNLPQIATVEETNADMQVFGSLRRTVGALRVIHAHNTYGRGPPKHFHQVRGVDGISACSYRTCGMKFVPR